MLIVAFTWSAWVLFSPLNLYVSYPASIIPNTLLYTPIMYYLVRRWLRTMTKRKGGPAAGFDVVEPGQAGPEDGDELGTATRSYSTITPPRITGSKSDIREAPAGLERQFFVKLPDIEAGEGLFDKEELMRGAMVRSRVSSGGWIRKRISSRGSGSLKASEIETHGRSMRWRIPQGEPSSIHVPATVIAAAARSHPRENQRGIKISEEDLRENVFTGRTPLTVIMVIDVSMSMKASLDEIRQLVGRIERETRGSRDRAGIIAFKDNGAVEVQVPTSNWNKIYRALARLKLSGLTPIADAMMKALESIRRERMRNPGIEPLVVLISDFAPNIPLAQGAGPGHARYTPVRDLVYAARLLKREKVRLAAVNVDRGQRKWPRFLKLPYHDSLELATTLRMRKEGLSDQLETILSVPEFRQEFGAYLIARAAGGRAFLSDEILREKSVLGAFLRGSGTRSRLRAENLKRAESYIAR